MLCEPDNILLQSLFGVCQSGASAIIGTWNIRVCICLSVYLARILSRNVTFYEQNDAQINNINPTIN